MEVISPVVSVTRSMLHPEDATRPSRTLLQVDDRDRPRALSENTRWAGEQGPGPATLVDSPPRTDSIFASDATTADTTALTLEETIALFRTKLEDARKETEHAFASGEEVSDAVKPKLTLDLGHSNIARLPETVLEMIKAEVERLSLSHNQIWHIPPRISECSHLRYLNIRTNAFREIPRGIFKMPLLEILDISRNKVRKIPKEIRNLTSLRVFAIAHNRIDDLPTELCELNKLTILKIAENPLQSKIKGLVEAKEAEVAYTEMNDQERETAVTFEIKKYLRDNHPVSIPDFEPMELIEAPVETTPKPLKRVLSGRFPVVPARSSSENLSDGIKSSPNQGRIPILPNKSHLRGPSAQSLYMRRPAIVPVVNVNERNRSNSESVVQASGAVRIRRMGVQRKERSDLDSIDETKSNRHSHLRGFSHGSALRRNSSISSPVAGNSSPVSPRDVRRQRMPFVKRLSSLPEHKSQREVTGPVIEGAKGVLYALYQIHPQVSSLIAAMKGRDARRSSLETTFYNASTHVDKLNEALEHADLVDPEDEDAMSNAEDTVQRDCEICIMAYTHVTSQLQDNVRKIVAGTDPRYVRTLMLLLYGSIVEIKNAVKSFGVEVRNHKRRMSSGATHPIQTIPEEMTTPQQPVKSQTPSRDRNVTVRQGSRLRSDTTIQHPGDMSNFQPVQPSIHSQVSHNMNLTGSTLGEPYSRTSSYTNVTTYGRQYGLRSRSNSRHTNYTSDSSMANTPHSMDSFNLPPQTTGVIGRINPVTNMTDAQEESCFEQIFLALSKSYDSALQAVPVAKQQFQRCFELAEENRQPKEIRNLWFTLVHRCKSCINSSEALQIRLTHMRIKDPRSGSLGAAGGRNDPQFWLLCKAFLQSFVELVTDMREAKELHLLPPQILHILRPVQKASRDAGRLIETSPWRYLTDGVGVIPAPTPLANGGINPHHTNGYRNGNSVQSSASTYSPGLGIHQVNSSNGTYQPQYHNAHASTPLPANIQLPPLQAPVYNSVTNNGVSPVPVQLPATPLSAALGPAAQATIPSTPASAYSDSFFRGDVFQRADSLMNMPAASGSVNFLNRRG